VWQLLTANHVQLWLRFDKLPTVVEVATAFRQQVTSGIYYDDLFGSLRRITTGFTLAAAVGVALGVLVSRSPVASDLLRPVLEVIRPIPAIALVPVAILLFPENEQGIVFITFLAAFFPVLVSTMHTVRALPTIWEDAVRTMGGGRLRVLWHVVLPGSLPGIFGGLSVAIGVAWICVISAEMISGESGVGYRTWQAYSIVDYPNVIVGMLSIGVLGFLTAAGLELLGRRVTSWLPQRVEGAS
jgi:NitT/TauT family transport system permease protein